jgi:hypothetical protein
VALPDENHPPGHANHVSTGVIGLKVGVLFADLAERMRASNTHWIGLGPAPDQLGALLHTDAHLFAGVGGFD